jgi:hypothetical protein
MRNECAEECAEGSNNGTRAKDNGDRYVTGRLSYATGYWRAGGGVQGRKRAESIPIGAALDLLCLAKAR